MSTNFGSFTPQNGSYYSQSSIQQPQSSKLFATPAFTLHYNIIHLVEQLVVHILLVS